MKQHEPGLDPRLLYPTSYETSPFPALCQRAFTTLGTLMPGGDLPRVPGWQGGQNYAALLDRYGQLPRHGAADAGGLLEEMVRDLLAGAVNWRCSELQYNLGAAVNVVAAAIYALALDVNVYLINDGLAGNAIVAEAAVSRILAGLSGVDPELAYGLFTFGGTGTMAYAIKAGIRKAAPDSARQGTPSDVRIMITDDAHFSHGTAADWLGLGSDQVVVAPADEQRRTRLDAAERLLRAEIESGNRIATILLNGGTTYDHTVDDIPGFRALRDRLVADYRLDYRPHLHVDSVVGWIWLVFAGSDFSPARLGVRPEVVAMLAEQYRRISYVRLADSWGVDFHKGAGGCPIDCSFIQFNDRADCGRLRKGGPHGTDLHQLAQDFSTISPVDYTLETSRSGGKALAALASLHSLGQDGYPEILADLMDATYVFRRKVAARSGMTVLNPAALGYQTMVRLVPPDAGDLPAERELHELGDKAAQRVASGNRYLKAFFAWDNETRMNANAGGVVYSFSSKYITTASGIPISGLKFYPTSPHIHAEHMKAAADLLAEQKRRFDTTHRWQLHGDPHASRNAAERS